MSRRNGDRARFQKDRKRKIRHRQRVRELVGTLHAQGPALKVVAETGRIG